MTEDTLADASPDIGLEVIASVDRGWFERNGAIIAFAHLPGLRSAGPKMKEVASALFNGLLRAGRLKKNQDPIRGAG